MASEPKVNVKNYYNLSFEKSQTSTFKIFQNILLNFFHEGNKEKYLFYLRQSILLVSSEHFR